jgi:hypothetical protein
VVGILRYTWGRWGRQHLVETFGDVTLLDPVAALGAPLSQYLTPPSSWWSWDVTPLRTQRPCAGVSRAVMLAGRQNPATCLPCGGMRGSVMGQHAWKCSPCSVSASVAGEARCGGMWRGCVPCLSSRGMCPETSPHGVAGKYCRCGDMCTDVSVQGSVGWTSTATSAPLMSRRSGSMPRWGGGGTSTAWPAS